MDARVELDEAEHAEELSLVLGDEKGEALGIFAPPVLPREQLGVARQEVAAAPFRLDKALQLGDATALEPLDPHVQAYRASRRRSRVPGAAR